MSLPSKTSAPRTAAKDRFSLICSVLAVIVALGLIAAGLRWAHACGKGYEETLTRTNAHHIELFYPYGLSTEELKSIQALGDVSDVEGIYCAYECFDSTAGQAWIRLCSLTERIDKPDLVEGKLPQAENEIALARDTAELLGKGLGDTIEFDGERERDAAGLSAGTSRLKTRSFVLVGLLEAPLTMVQDDGGYGLAPTEWGLAQGCGWIAPSAFSEEAVQGGYAYLALRSKSLEGHPVVGLSDEVGSDLVRELEGLGSEQAHLRFVALHERAQQEVNEKAALLAESKAVMESGVAALHTATTQIVNAQSMITSTNALIPTYDAQVKACEADLNKKKEELKKVQDAQKPALDKAKAQLDSVQAEYDAAAASGSEKLAEINQRLQTKKSEYTKAEETYKKAVETPQKQVDAATTQLANARATLNGAYQQIEELKQEIAQANEIQTEETKGFSEDQKDIVQKVNMLAGAQQRLQGISDKPWQITLASEQGLVGTAGQYRRALLSLTTTLGAMVLITALLICVTYPKFDNRTEEGELATKASDAESPSEMDARGQEEAAAEVIGEGEPFEEPALEALPEDDERSRGRRFLNLATLVWSCALLVACCVVWAQISAVLDARVEADQKLDALVLVDATLPDASSKIQEELGHEGAQTTPVLWQNASISLGQGRAALATLLASESGSAGSWELSDSSTVYVCKAYEEMLQANQGDDVLLLDGRGSALHMPAEAYLENPLADWQVLMGSLAYEKSCGVAFEPNAIYVSDTSLSVREIRENLAQMKGALSVVSLGYGGRLVSQSALIAMKKLALLFVLAAALLFCYVGIRTLARFGDASFASVLACAIVLLVGGALFGMLTGWRVLDCAGAGPLRFVRGRDAYVAVAGLAGAIAVTAGMWLVLRKRLVQNKRDEKEGR